MRIGSVVMLVVALGFGGMAAFLAKVWLENQTPEPKVAVQRPAVKVSKVVVATRPLRFGMELKRSHLTEIEWPDRAIPNEAYPSIAELFKGNGKRIVLSAIARNEPIIKTKVTGPGQRASLSALVDDRHLAVSVRVNDVLGVAGFVLPGDRVDVLLTREEKAEVSRGPARKLGYTDVLLRSVRVLAVDQLADDQTQKPSLSKTVTLEVNTRQAQKVALAESVGKLSLALRSAGSTQTAPSRRITLEDLRGDNVVKKAEQRRSDQPIMVFVTRAVERQEYVVPTHGAGR